MKQLKERKSLRGGSFNEFCKADSSQKSQKNHENVIENNIITKIENVIHDTNELKSQSYDSHYDINITNIADKNNKNYYDLFDFFDLNLLYKIH